MKTTATKMSSSQAPLPQAATTRQLFTTATAPQFTYKEYTAVEKAQMLRNYTGYHQESIAFAQECMDRVAREHGNYC
jgi:hypothetical protein